MAKKPDNPADHPLWKRVAKDITPLKKSDTYREAPPKMRSSSAGAIKRINRPVDEASLTFTPSKSTPAPSLDRKTRRRLNRHEGAVDRVIDLHGLSREKAYALLASAIPSAHAAGETLLLVITGKGGNRFQQRGSDLPAQNRKRADFALHEGILRSALPEWLNSRVLRPYISGFQQAGDRRGGAGAYYIRLKTRKQSS